MRLPEYVFVFVNCIIVYWINVILGHPSNPRGPPQSTIASYSTDINVLVLNYGLHVTDASIILILYSRIIIQIIKDRIRPL